MLGSLTHVPTPLPERKGQGMCDVLMSKEIALQGNRGSSRKASSTSLQRDLEIKQSPQTSCFDPPHTSFLFNSSFTPLVYMHVFMCLKPRLAQTSTVGATDG